MSTNGTGTHAAGERLVGLVEAVNERGVKIGGAWRNYSKWAVNLTPPPRGAHVAVAVDGQGFVRSIELAEAGSPTGEAVPSKDILIIRQTCVKAAAEFCASRPDLRSADLLALAERLEAWITR